MTGKNLHIVCFDIPLPANYGGVIDVFYKIKALSEIGWKIHLHCFSYVRDENILLEKYCEKVFYYKRNFSLLKLFSSLPYIVASRDSSLLLTNLLKDGAPILFEGLHTTFHLQNKKISSRCCMVRTHNIEHVYYRALASCERNIFKRMYFISESSKLEKYESILNKAKLIAAIADHERNYFQNKFGDKTFELPPFHAFTEITSLTGTGKFALYHGNLSVAENLRAVFFLIDEVFSKTTFKLIIAGNNPSAALRKKVNNFPNIILDENPSDDRMIMLQHEAQIHVLPTFQSTGIKLKLLNALFTGRHVLVNDAMLEGTSLEKICHVANSPDEWKEKIKQLMETPFTDEIILQRKQFLFPYYSNTENAKLLSEKISSYMHHRY